MCISAKESKMSNTKIYAGEHLKDNEIIHVLAYQNSAQNLSDGPNAMILPFPSKEEMGEENIIDTRSFPNFLKNIEQSTKNRRRSLTKSLELSDSIDSIKIFKSGSYTVLLSKNIDKIENALLTLAENERPTISSEFLIKFGQMYPTHQIAVCCWDGNVKAEPLLWWYKPKNPKMLFIPTMDSHDGTAPNANIEVESDHFIALSSYNLKKGYEVNYIDLDIPDEVLFNYLPKKVKYIKLKQKLKNGDMFFNTSYFNDNLSLTKMLDPQPHIKRNHSKFYLY